MVPNDRSGLDLSPGSPPGIEPRADIESTQPLPVITPESAPLPAPGRPAARRSGAVRRDPRSAAAGAYPAPPGAEGARREVREPREPRDPTRVVRKGVKAMLSRLRLLPVGPTPKEIDHIVREVKAHHPKADVREMVRAYELARVAHEGQYRKSGEMFIEHPIGVASILARLGMDATTIVGALLHDAVEDTDLELSDIEQSFGSEVAEIIDGLTKLDKLQFRSKEQERAENLRKMIVAMAKDLRVLIIKLADRLHNMRTLGALAPAKRELIATETLEIYAKLADRLGMQPIKAELEDLAFQNLHPKAYEEIAQMVAQRQPEREVYLQTVVDEVQARLRDVRVRAFVSGRPKHFYSIYEKMTGRGREFDQIFDLVGVRIIVESERDCYAALGAIHSLWKPVPGRFKDYIAMPKFNLYQSLHTTVIGPEGKPLEVQMRTREMHRTAEWGVASHWRYKEDARADKGGKPGLANEEQAAWMRRMLDLQQTEDDREFLDTLKLDLFAGEVFVFTPRGDIVQLPKGATPVDFAYAIHTEVGHACAGARVDGRLVPLDHQLSSGETVQIVTSKTSTGPSRDWLNVVVTPRARTKIRQWFTKERREEAIAVGKDAVAKAIRRAGLPLQRILADGELGKIATELRFASTDAFYVSVGEGRTSLRSVVARLLRHQVEPLVEEPAAPTPARARPTTTDGVIVEGVDDVLVKLARCCMPVPGDPIVGFITRGRGISVHRADCTNIEVSLERERLIDVAWNTRATGLFPVSIGVEALDRPKLLRDVSTAISEYGVNISGVSSTTARGIAQFRFTVGLVDPASLDSILNGVRRVESVYDAFRVTPGRA
ncbi:MAG TPA: bifunctional (p)ppGpp synthetase/guanosine-3',5'-bis(diphosphate) 3'-pyrophosphohydrolase [Actinomycetota bacterium]|nr:bifunctional (p)ppGpp synthetase/guanosine-3',5'-bis(diphosphate) 3'-pyrophosphohydrolase [Actinomycetota bacterium]